MELLRQDAEDRLAARAVADPRAMRLLVGRLWEPDEAIRRTAARAVGQAASLDERSGGDLVHRLLWALNEESGTNGVYALPALGEIGRRAPELLGPSLPTLVSLAPDAGLRLALLRALESVAAVAPRLVASHLDELREFVDTSRAEERDALDRLEQAAGRRSEGDH